MSLFQKTVISKYLRTQNIEDISSRWKNYQNHFLNPRVQKEIKGLKEEQYQGEFLEDLFVKILGYTKPASSSETQYNLTTEYKNVKDSKKADGAIVIEDKVKAVIELKGTNTTDLGRIEAQAFGYKNNQPECVYVITSNFEKLRFYIDNAIEHIEFNLFTLKEEEFTLLYLCLGYENLSKDTAKKIKEESLSEEDVITKKLYKDYSLFKRELHQSLVLLNPSFEPLELFKKSQKLLDRFLFLFFGEDRHLLPPNSVRLILADWRDLQDRDVEVPLYDRFKKYFGYLNTGFKGKRYDVFAYNGGLFKPDEILDIITIDDELLNKHALKLSDYDFASEVDVNILGHIFENSLNELDEIKAQLEGQEIDKSKTKRKKEGVFYTPKYITKYIVENTVGKLCEEKKTELEIVEEDYFTDKKRQKKTIKGLIDKLEGYRKWLLQLTICDPACGSGAFLNQTLDFLIEEHQYIDELQAKLFGDALILSDMENSILENNLFGVDLNEESVEIVKLSLWLRTAQPNRKLNDLNNNIKCGNSLIDDVEIAGDKAFNWQTAFPKVFKEKNKKAWHITTAIHDSRTSQRMIDHKVREKRAMGTMINPQIIPLTEKEETIIVNLVSEIVIEDKLSVMAFNVCKDHMHLVLVCDEDDLCKIVQKIKAKTARAVNINRGVTTTTTIITMEHAPLSIESIEKKTRGEKQNSLWTQKFGCKEIINDSQLQNTIEYVRNNRMKHELPLLSVLEQWSMLHCLYQSYNDAFKEEYSGGFDVVIGNPPYVRQELFKEIKPYLEKNYKCYNSIADLYTYFIELGIKLMNEKGKFSFILPNKFLKATYGKEIRKVILESNNIELLYDFDDYPVFDDATTYPIIYILNKRNDWKIQTFIYSEISRQETTTDPISLLDSKAVKVNFSSLNDEVWQFKDVQNSELLAKLIVKSKTLKEVVNDKIFRGVSTGKNEVFIIDENIANQLLNEKNKSFIRKIVTGKEVKRNNLNFNNLYLLYIPWEYDLDFDDNIKNYLINHKVILENRPEVKEGRFNWWCLSRYGSKNSEFLFKPKIIYPRINNQCNFYFDATGEYSLSDNNFFISTNEMYILPILNSKLIYYYLKSIASTLQGGYLDFRRPYIETIPIKKPSNVSDYIRNSNFLIEKNRQFQQQSHKFQRTIQRKFDLEELPKKLQDWYKLTYSDFIKELAKKKVKISLSQEAEWEDYFIQESKKVLELKSQIDATDKAIDKMVYELYGLSEEEIAIVENS